MSKWFLWHRKRHEKVETGFDTKAAAQRWKVGVTRGRRREAWVNVYRTNVVPATDALLDNPEHRHYYWS